MLTFDPIKHEYQFRGVKVPGVTSILSPLQDFSKVNPEVMLAAQQRGTAIHLMTELYDANDLDEDGLSDEMRPRLDAYKKFLLDTGFVPLTREKLLYHPTMKYAGRSDETGLIRGRMAVVDIKSMFMPGSPIIGLQLAAYENAHIINGDKVQDRYALHLRHDGTYRLQPYTDPNDIIVFASLLNIKNWKDKYNHGN